MVRNRDPFSTALASLRHRLAEGRYGDGAPIVIQYEAQRLRLSTTPVREALAWLCGAGLVERAPTAGYTASRLDAGAVRDWYGFRRDCLLLSLEGLTAPSVGSALPEDLPGLFDWIVGRGGNGVRARAFRRVGLHLERLEAAEHHVLGDRETATRDMLQAVSDNRMERLIALIDSFHQARISAAAELAFEVAHAPPDDGEL